MVCTPYARVATFARVAARLPPNEGGNWMKKLTLRTEHLGELASDELLRIAGAAHGAGVQRTYSDGSCICTDIVPLIAPLVCTCDFSAGSCGCKCGYV